MNIIKNAPKQTLFKAHGGKFMLRKWIINHLPRHHAYIEPFCGAANILFAKPKSYFELINDTNKYVYTCFKVMQDIDKYKQLKRKLYFTSYSKETLYEALNIKPNDNEINIAWKLIVTTRFMLGAVGNRKPIIHTSYTNITPVIKTFIDYQDFLPFFHKRLRSVILENKNGFDIIKQFDKPSALIYCDPPYHPSTYKVTKEPFFNNLQIKQHIELVNILLDSSAMVVLSGFDNRDYNVLVENGWKKHKKSSRSGFNYKGKSKKTECLWINPKAQNK